MEPTSEVIRGRERAIALSPAGACVYEAELLTGARLRVIADEVLIAEIVAGRSLGQLANVTVLPGVVGPAIGMPDMHEGYGFPVGGVAATLLPHGAISPGGIGFDINCGVRLLSSGVPASELRGEVARLMHQLARAVPSGYGRGSLLALDDRELGAVLRDGARQVVNGLGLGSADDLDCIESGGALSGADPSQVSPHARERGRDQLGTLGGGNHFLELQVVDEIFDQAAASAMRLRAGDLTVLVHTGSRGLGHQVCVDHLRAMDESGARYGFTLPDRQLACAPFDSPEGRRYWGAMCAAANFAFANRQVLTARLREVFHRELGARTPDLRVVYDVAHNIAKRERHLGVEVLVHRKGATRALGPSSPELPARYRQVGQPVFIPGSMGSASFVLAGNDASAQLSLSSCCHGAGRVMSRAAAKREVRGSALRESLETQGIAVECASNAELAEEAPAAYKDVERVASVVERAGIARRVARLRPLGVLKG